MLHVTARSSRLRFGFVAAVLSISVLGACGSDSASTEITPNDTEFEVDVGDEFTVTLESNVTTGYSWQLEQPLDDSLLTLVDDDYIAPETDTAGAPGEQQLTFRSVGGGNTTIELWYIRPFDNPPDPAERSSFPVVISAD